MKRSRFGEERIIGMPREHEAGPSTADVCRKHGIGSATFGKFEARFGGLEVSEARRLTFAPGEACQFDRSHEIVPVSGVTVTVKVAHGRLPDPSPHPDRSVGAGPDPKRTRGVEIGRR